MNRFQGAASIGIIRGADGPTAVYLTGKDVWKRLARQGLLVVAACLAVWRLARRIYKRK